MASQFHRGIRPATADASWHGREEPVNGAERWTAAALAQHMIAIAAWAKSIVSEGIYTASGLTIPGTAIVAEYADDREVAYGPHGEGYRAVGVQRWAEICEAAMSIDGAKLSFAGALGVDDTSDAIEGTSRKRATYAPRAVRFLTLEMARAEGFVEYVCVRDSLDGSLRLSMTKGPVRAVCANTISSNDVQIGVKHTRHSEPRIGDFVEAIASAPSHLSDVVQRYAEARRVRLTEATAARLIDCIAPPGDLVRDKHPRIAARLDREREETLRAWVHPTSLGGPGEADSSGTLAQAMNASTYVATRRGTALDRAEGPAETVDGVLDAIRRGRSPEGAIETAYQRMVAVLRPDGSEVHVPEDSADAADAYRAIGASMMADALGL